MRQKHAMVGWAVVPVSVCSPLYSILSLKSTASYFCWAHMRVMPILTRFNAFSMLAVEFMILSKFFL